MTRFIPRVCGLIAMIALVAACSEETATTPSDASAADAAADVVTSEDGATPSDDVSSASDATSGPETVTSTDTQSPVDDAESAADVVAPGLPEETGPGLGIDWESVEATIVARYDPFATDWMARGWPNDVLRREDGTVDLSNFPDPGIDLLASYLVAGSEVLDGWGLNGAIYAQIAGTVDMDALPSEADSTDPLSLIQLVNVSAASARYGERVPLAFRWYGGGDDDYYMSGTLAMRPSFGFPLAEGDQYCAIITRGVTDPDGGTLAPTDEFLAAWEDEPTLSQLVTWLNDSPLHRQDIAFATCFTTQHATGELRRVRQYLDATESPEVAFVSEPKLFDQFHGTYIAPNFQAGEKPYAEEGGAIAFDDSGAPIVQSEEELRFFMLIPQDQEMPEGGWPVVLYGHGTGGDYDSCKGVSDELLPLGYALLCIDQPLHGNRGPEGQPALDDSELVIYSFNFLNAGSGRSSFRQAAIDSMLLARMVSAGRFDLSSEETSTGRPVALDGGRISFFGHSHGGLSGALVMGVDPIFEAAVLSGAGGLLVNTILLRKDPVDVKALMQTALGIKASNLDSFHPAMSLVQMMVDCTDPVNYAPHWLASGPDATPKHIFVTEGTGDHATPGLTTETMTGAGGLPLIGPLANRSLTHDLAQIPTVDWPLSGNITTEVGDYTAAVKQWEGGSHWIALNGYEARSAWRTFFKTLHEGVPTLGIGDYPVSSNPHLAQADTCEGANHITGADLPVVLTGNTTLATDDYAAVGCNGGSDTGATRRDVAWAFTPAVTGTYRMTLTRPVPQGKDEPPTGPNRLYVALDCEDIGAGCALTTDDQLYVSLDAGVTVYVIVDGSGIDHRGPFSLSIRAECESLSCEDRVCGAWGCGSCGSCGIGEVCNADGQCEPSDDGDLCETAGALSEAPFIAHGDTAGMSNDYSFSDGDCPGEGTGRGAGSADAVTTFVAPTTDRWVFRLDSDYDAALYVVEACEAISDTCLGAQRAIGKGEALHLELVQGQAVFVIVDGAYNNSDLSGRYTLRVDACVPDCEGRACGGDGCGGSCGECTAVETCDSDTLCNQPFPFSCETTRICEPRPEADVCANALVADVVPFDHSGSTIPHHNDFSHGGGDCPGDSGSRGGGSPDAVVAFTAPEEALYHFEVSASWDSTLYLLADCEDVSGSCLGGDQVNKKGGEELYVALAAGETVFAIVDGGHASDKKHGSYTLEIDTCEPTCEGVECGSDGCGGSCGGCASTDRCSSGACVPKVGDSCDDSIKVGNLSWSDSEDTANFTPVVAPTACEGLVDGAGEASPEVVYRLKSGSAGTYRVTLDAEFEAALYAVTGCDAAASCLGTTSDVLDLELESGVTVYLVVDGAGTEASSGGFSVEVDKLCFPDCDGRSCGGDGCGGSCGVCVAPEDLCDSDSGQCSAPSDQIGNTCQAPFEVDLTEGPYVAVGDTQEALNHYGVGASDCAGYVGMGQGSPEEVYHLTAPEDGGYRVELASYGFDAVLYVLTDCEAIQTSCYGMSDTRTEEVVWLALSAGESVFLVVDGTSNSAPVSGGYELRVIQE